MITKRCKAYVPTFGNFLKLHREAAGLSQEQLAKALGYTGRQFVSNWERGISGPPMRLIRQIAELIQVHPDQLYEVFLEDTLFRKEQEMNRTYYADETNNKRRGAS